MMVLALYVLGVHAALAGVDDVRETIRLDKGWRFAMGHASDPLKDFGCGTEYFNYLTKANLIPRNSMILNGKKFRYLTTGYRLYPTLKRPVIRMAIRL